MGENLTPNRVLDRDALDVAADSAIAGLTVDLLGAQRLVVERRRRRVRRWLVVAASAAAAVLIAVTLTPVALLLPPLPATVPTGPARLPATVGGAPVWIPTAAQSPIGRALFVVQLDPMLAPQQLQGRALGPVLVGADPAGGDGGRGDGGRGGGGRRDGAGYRRLPSSGQVSAVALSPDGRRVAWTDGGGRIPEATRVQVLDLRSGRVVGQELAGRFGRGVAVDTLAFSPDGARLALGGDDRFAGGRSPAVYVLDAAAGRVISSCACGGLDGVTQGVAWAADGRVLTAVGTPGVTGVGGVTGSGGVTGVTGGGVMPVRAERSWGGGHRPDAVQPSTAVSATGAQRYWVGLDGADQPAPAVLRSSALDGTSRQVATLGPVLGAVALADTPRGVLVFRWGSDGGDLVAVRADGQVDVLTRSSGPAVVAAAAGLLADARPAAAGAALPVGWRSLSWYRWQVARAWGAVAVPGAGFVPTAALVLALVIVVAPVRRRVARAARAARGQLGPLGGAAHSRPVKIGVALVAVGCLAASVLLPTEAPPVPAGGASSGGARTPVVPSVVRVQALLPPRAFDAGGRPRTVRISMMFGASYAGEQRLLGVDADTGTLVRLDDLPGVSYAGEVTMFLMGDSRSGGISPNGRFIALGPLVIDLRTATARKVAEAGQSTGGSAVTDDGTLLAVVPGTQNRVTIARPGERGRTLEGSEGTYSLEPGGGGLVLTRFLGEPHRKDDQLVDVIDPGARRYLGPLTGLGQSVPAAVLGTVGSGAPPEVYTVDPKTGRLVRRGDPAGTAVRTPGSVEVLSAGAGVGAGAGAGGGLVAAGYGGPGMPYAVLRGGATEGQLRPVTRLELLEQGSRERPALAGDVIAQARVVDVPAPRWDGQVGWPIPLRWIGALLLLGLATIRASRPRADPARPVADALQG